MSKFRPLIINRVKKFLRIPLSQTLSIRNYIKYLRLRVGPRFYTKKYNTSDIINIMQSMGMREGSNVFIHSAWDEFYNYIGSEKQLIEAILEVIGDKGTLIMPAFPLLRKGKTFNLKRTPTKAGMLAEEFRKYPGVKRSINIQHSVCALGPLADYLLSEHHLGDSCWDSRSPYYKLASCNALVFSLGLRKFYIGALVHCVESILRSEVKYFSDFFRSEKTLHEYIDYDGILKTYTHYDLAGGKFARVSRHLGTKIMALKYFDKSYYRLGGISNLRISVFYADKVIPRMIELGRKGITIYKKPRKKGYKFN